jgi:hypothetical protein
LRTLTLAQSDDPQTPKETLSVLFFLGAQAANDFFDVDCARMGTVSCGTEAGQALDGGTAPQQVDQNGGIEQDGGQSAHTAGIGVTLCTYPFRRIIVPLVPVIVDRAERSLHELPAMLILERASDGGRNECAAPPSPHAAVQLGHERIIQAYVHTHAHSLTHNWISSSL